MTDQRSLSMRRRVIALFAVAALLFIAAPALAQEPTDAPAWTNAGMLNPRDYLIPTPQSSCFSRYGYALEQGCLFLEFRESGGLYVYSGVDFKVWNAFARAGSLEAYYEQSICGAYPCFRIR